MHVLIRDSSFESEMLGVSVVSVEATHDCADADFLSGLSRALHLTEAGNDGLVSVRIPATAEAWASHLFDSGFQLVERLLTLKRPTARSASLASVVHVATAADVRECQEIARSSFTYDRFHRDPTIPDDRADALKAAWITNSIEGRGDLTLVVREEGRVLGFLTSLRSAEHAVIDLIAVDRAHRGKGYARALVEHVLDHYHRADVPNLIVGTQASNADSLGLYRRMDFLPVAERLTFHLSIGRAVTES